MTWDAEPVPAVASQPETFAGVDHVGALRLCGGPQQPAYLTDGYGFTFKPAPGRNSKCKWSVDVVPVRPL